MNGIILSSLAHLSGYLIFITYAAHIFEQVGASQVDPYISSIALGKHCYFYITCQHTFTN